MPEGPEIWRLARRLDEALAGCALGAVRFGLESLKGEESRLSGATIERVRSRGKALLIDFDNGLHLYSHNQLYGRWELLVAGERRPRTKRQLRVAIHTAAHSALLYSASDIAVLDDAGVARHPFLSRLGPDLLAPATNAAMLLSRLRDSRFHRRRLAGLLTDQGFVAGIGNYLRCEILFVCGLHPTETPAALETGRRSRLVEAMLALPRQSADTGGVTNDLARYERLRDAGRDFEQARFHVFRREGEACYRCGSTIVKHAMAGQPCYLCPACQAGET